MGEVRTQTISGVKWTGIESVALQAIQFVIGIIIARILTPTEYGLVGMVGIFIAIASTFVDSGMTNALVRKKNVTSNDYSTVYFFNIGVGVFFYVLLFVCAPLIAYFFNEPALKNIVRVISLNFVIGAFGGVQGAKFTRDLEFKVLAKISTLSTLVSGVLGIIMAYSGFGVWALVFQQVITTLLSVVLKNLLSKWRPFFIFSKDSFSELFGYGSKLLASGLIHTIYINLTTLLIGKFYTPENLGYYSRGQSIPSILDATILGVLSRVSFPILAKFQEDKDMLVGIYRKYIKCTSIPIYFLLILLAAISKPLILFLLTDKWEPAIPYLQIFCFVFLLDNISSLNLSLLQVLGRSDLFLRLEILKKSISLAMLLASVPFGVIAICIMKLIYSFIAVVVNTYYTGKLCKLGFIEQFKDFSPYILYSIIASIPAFFLTFTNLQPFFICLIGGLWAIVIYCAILWIAKDEIYKEYVVDLIIPKMLSLIHRK